MATVDTILLWGGALLLAGVLSSKISDRFSIPVLLLFMGIGMLSGSEGPGGIAFDDPRLAKSLGTVALAFIIFSGGFDTRWEDSRAILRPGLALSTLGVLITAALTGLASVWILGFSPLDGFLLGSIVSSTDAAAVFSILRSKRIGLKRPLRPLLEFESGSNDPMAVFLTVTAIGLIRADVTASSVLPRFVLDMGIGAVAGVALGRLTALLLRRINLEFEGLYPVLTIAMVALTYAVASLLKGNGFLAVYAAGLVLGREEFPQKRSIMRFHDGVAWIMQIAMFVCLGLLVFPSRVVALAGPGLLLTLFLMLAARPVAVFLSLWPFGIGTRKKALVAWTGLRGSAPIILATFPFMAGIPQAETIFNVVFFVVIASVFIQGTSIPWMSRVLNLHSPGPLRATYPLMLEKTPTMDADLTDVIIPYDSWAVGRRLNELGLPEKCLVVLIARAGSFVIPSGPTALEGGDVLLSLANAEDMEALRRIVTRRREGTPEDPGTGAEEL